MEQESRTLTANQRKVRDLARLAAYAVDVRFSAGAVAVLAAKRGVEHGLEGFSVVWPATGSPYGVGRFHGWPNAPIGYTAVVAYLKRITAPG